MNYRETMSRLNNAMSNIDSAYAVIAKKHGLTFNALMIIYIIDESDNITQKKICDILHLPKSTVHSILSEFINQKYISLVAGNNKKEKFVTITEIGIQHFKTVLKETQLFEDKILSILGDDTCIFLVETAEKLGCIIKNEILEIRGNKG
ncbi:MarR family winged helix-turn-helix transcriptional regulator [uncultured Robinsoniella sp.]|uniref:MarR family winged helix-turn-helix transcriptional regulator n=1 Tax=uncultured Robinsoniella sp. TaxID=904190 RepID=UPI00374E7E6A